MTTSPTASSIARSTSSSSSIPDAAALSATCSGREAPMMAEATFGFYAVPRFTPGKELRKLVK